MNADEKAARLAEILAELKQMEEPPRESGEESFGSVSKDHPKFSPFSSRREKEAR